MDENNFGIEKFDGEDAAYKGSRYSEVRDVIFANPYQKIWAAPASRRFRSIRRRCPACCAAS